MHFDHAVPCMTFTMEVDVGADGAQRCLRAAQAADEGTRVRGHPGRLIEASSRCNVSTARKKSAVKNVGRDTGASAIVSCAVPVSLLLRR